MNNISNNRVPLTVEDCIAYMDKMKHRYRQRPQTYNSFLDVLRDYRSEIIDEGGVAARAAILFQGEPDLIEDLNKYLSPEHRIGVGLEEQRDIEVIVLDSDTNVEVETRIGSSSLGVTANPNVDQKQTAEWRQQEKARVELKRKRRLNKIVTGSITKAYEKFMLTDKYMEKAKTIAARITR